MKSANCVFFRSALKSGVPVLARKSKSDHRPRRLDAFRIAIQFFLFFVLAGIVLRRRIHPRTVALVVPPGQTEITRHHVCARMHVTNHALRGRNLARELMLDRVTRFVFWNVRVSRLRTTKIAGLIVES